MNPKTKRFQRKYQAAADAIARIDLPQEHRDRIAADLTEAFRGQPDFLPELFQLLASDPLCPCAGFGDEPCPEGREIRVGMHLSSAADGRSQAWSSRRPVVRCVPCGSRQFLEQVA